VKSPNVPKSQLGWLNLLHSGRTSVFPCPALDLQLTGDHLCG